MHPTDLELLSYLEDSLAPAQSQLIDSHLDECDLCQSRIEGVISSAFEETTRAIHNGQRSAVTYRDISDAADTIPTRTTGAKPKQNARQSEVLRQGIGRRFMVIEEIERGGMGVVYLGFDRELKREVAIKVAHPEASGVRFYSEARIAAQLQHPGIVPVHQTGQLSDGRQYIAMKLVKGRTLSALMSDEDKQRETSSHFDVFRDICNTMAYAHSRDIIHRDLKPDNVMVGMFGEVQIMDWGLAKKLSNSAADVSPKSGTLTDRKSTDTTSTASPKDTISPLSTHAGAVFGTPAYMSPEQARGAVADKRTDVFAMGGILYEILTGKPPFDAPTVSVALKQSIDSDLESAFERLDTSNADSELIELVKSCLAPTIEHRPADASDVQQYFIAYQADREKQFDETRLEKARATERLVAQQKRIRQLVWSSSAIVVTLLASVAAGYLYLTEKNARLANEANVEREQLQQLNQDENKIRDKLASARKHQAIAALRAPLDQPAEWLLALKEIENATPIVTDAISDDLRNEFNQLADQIRNESASASAARVAVNIQLEAECCDEILVCCEESYYPEDMRICQMTDLSKRFTEIYAKLGIEPHVTSTQTIERLSQSKYKTQLIQGLIVWNREIPVETTRADPESLVELQAMETWVRRLIARVDPHPFRSQLRTLYYERKNEQLHELLKTDQAVQSQLTIHTAASMIRTNLKEHERIDYLLRAHQNFPDDFMVNWYLVVMTRGGETRTEFALSCYALRPRNPAALAALGTAYLFDDKYDHAIETLEKLVDVAPWYYVGHMNLGAAYRRNGSIEEAEKRFRIAVDVKQSVASKFNTRIKQLREVGKDQRADVLEAFFAQPAKPAQPDTEKLLAKMAKNEQLFLADIPQCIDDITKKPKNLSLHGKLGKLYTSLCKIYVISKQNEKLDNALDTAISDFTKTAALAPSVSTSHEQLSKLCETYERFDVAIVALKKAIGIHPTYGPHFDRLAKLYTKACTDHERRRRTELLTQTVDAGINDLEEIAVRSLNGTNEGIGGYKRLANFCEDHHRYNEAIRAYDPIITSEPEYLPHRTKVGMLHYAAGLKHKLEGDHERAMQAFDQSIKVFQMWATKTPQESAPFERLSEALEQQGHFKKAMEALRVAITIHPKYTPHQFRFAKLCEMLSDQHKSKGEFKQAIGVLQNTIAFLHEFEFTDLRLTNLYDQLSKCHESEGTFSDAIVALNRVIEKHPGDRTLDDRLGRLLAKSGQHEQAEAVFLQLLEKTQSRFAVASAAQFYFEWNKPVECEQLIRRAFRTGTITPELKLLLAKSLIAQGKADSKASAKLTEGERIQEQLKSTSPELLYLQ